MGERRKPEKPKNLSRPEGVRVPRADAFTPAYFDKPTAHAVFSAVDSLRSHAGGEKLCVIKYIRLEGGMTRGHAIRILTEQLEYKYSQVAFHFWCDGSVSDAGSPQILAEV